MKLELLFSTIILLSLNVNSFCYAFTCKSKRYASQSAWMSSSLYNDQDSLRLKKARVRIAEAQGVVPIGLADSIDYSVPISPNVCTVYFVK